MSASRNAPRSVATARARLALLAIVVAAVLTSAGCTVVRLARGEGGANVDAIQPGVTRAAAEAVLASPVREWTSSGGIRYRIYQYDTGCPPNLTDAGLMLFADIATAGMWEVVEAVHWLASGKGAVVCQPRTTGRVLVAYDERDVVVGIFGEFDELPADGRSGPRKWR